VHGGAAADDIEASASEQVEQHCLTGPMNVEAGEEVVEQQHEGNAANTAQASGGVKRECITEVTPVPLLPTPPLSGVRRERPRRRVKSKLSEYSK